MNRSKEGRWECLTTGDRCDFYFLRKVGHADDPDKLYGYNLYHLTDLKARTDEEIRNIMGTFRI